MPWIARQGRHTLYLITFAWLIKPVFAGFAFAMIPFAHMLIGRRFRNEEESGTEDGASAAGIDDFNEG